MLVACKPGQTPFGEHLRFQLLWSLKPHLHVCCPAGLQLPHLCCDCWPGAALGVLPLPDHSELALHTCNKWSLIVHFVIESIFTTPHESGLVGFPLFCMKNFYQPTILGSHVHTVVQSYILNRSMP